MAAALALPLALAGIAAYLALAVALRRRSVRSRGASLRREGGLAAILPLFVPVPYAVLVLRPGPELAVPEPLRWVGLALVAGGIGFAAWAALTLGRHFDMEVEVHAGHQVVDAGPYAVVRHPVYAGLAAHLLGAGLATGNALLLAGTLLVAFPAFVARASLEERLLRAELGGAYDAYARRVGMLLPLLGRQRSSRSGNLDLS